MFTFNTAMAISTRTPWRLVLCALILLGTASLANAAASSACVENDGSTCYRAFQPPGARGVLHFYTSLDSAQLAAPTSALIAMHGHPRDANKTFDAAWLAAQRAGQVANTLIVAPVFQVAAADAGKCPGPGVPAAQAGDLLWTCGSWLEGSVATNDPQTSSFDALDALVVELKKQWPSLQRVTVAGFSAGAQMVQHYIGFAAQPAGLSLRYVVADPGTWLYFDRARIQPQKDQRAVDWSACAAADSAACTLALVEPTATCANANQWKYGTDGLPTSLKRTAAQARAQYAQSEVHYLEGALDSSDAKGSFYGILDKSCAAELQGPYRMQRGLAYAAYDRALLAPEMKRQVVIVPGCAHDVACAFPSEEAQSALFGRAAR